MDKQWNKRSGERLRDIRMRKGMQQKEVALDTGIPNYRVSRLEHGEGIPLTFWESLRFSRTYQCGLNNFNVDVPLGDVGLHPPEPEEGS